ncbi:MAG: DUF1189 domain-containing protein [Candidatus Gastranaerophilales bacterium]|nr:DUF1189 domain-containing protein [Candidatus Gastranaerophilales bacterium]
MAEIFSSADFALRRNPGVNRSRRTDAAERSDMDSNNFNNNQPRDPYSNTGSYSGSYNAAPSDGGYTGNGYSYGGGQPMQPQPPRKAPNIFKQFAYSFVPPKYDGLTRVKTGSMIGFVVLLTLVATLISFASLAAGLLLFDVDAIFGDVPDFEVKNGYFSIDEEYMYDEGDTLIWLTDEFYEFTYDDADYLSDLGYTQILLVAESNIALMQNGEYQEMDFNDFGTDLKLDKEWLVETFAPIVWIFLIVGYIFFFVGRTLWYFLCATFYFLIAMLIGQIMGKKVSSGGLFRVAVYSKVLMFVVALVFSLIPLVTIPIPGILRTAITIVFMSFAIWKLPEGC